MTRTLQVALPLFGLALVVGGPRTAQAGHAELESLRAAQKLTAQVSETGYDIRLRASQLTAIARDVGASRESHAAYLEGIRDLVNTRLQPALRDLTAMKQTLPPFKQEGIDRILDAARKLALEADGAMRVHLIDTRVTPSRIDEYRRRVDRLFEQSQALIRTSGTLADYTDAYVRAAELDLPGISG